MSALTIDNLSSVADMNAIVGGANVANIYKGSRIINGSWSYRATSYRRKGTAFSFRYGRPVYKAQGGSHGMQKVGATPISIP